MDMTGIGALAGDEGGSAAVEERPDEIAGAVALVAAGLADEMTDDDGANTQSAAGPVGQEAAEEDDGHDGEDAAAADDIISPAPAIDTAEESIAAARAEEGTPAAETTDADGQRGSDSASEDDAGGTPSEGDVAADAQAVLQFSKQELGSLLDELTEELIAPEDFKGNVDNQTFRNAWLGQHTPISQAAFLAEILRTGEYTEDLDENWVLLSDPDKSSLARKARARITRRVHRGWSENQKKAFILRLQARERSRTGKESRELERRTIEALLAMGTSYETIAKMAGVCPNTVRNIEKRAANDPNSKLVNTKRDRRRSWSTPENIAEARRLRAEEKKNNSQIAKALGTTPATIGKLFKDRGPQANAKIKEEPNPTPETAPDQSPPTPSQVDTTRVPDDGIPNVVRLHLEHRGLRGVPAAKEYAKLLKPQQDDAREKIEGLAKHKDELLKSYIYHREAATFAEAELERHLLAAGKAGAA